MSVQQAEDWLAFYQDYGPPESVVQWDNTLLYRISLLKAAKQHDVKSSSSSESTDVEEAAPIA